jgi:alpha-L-rhamnosidase
MSPSDRRTFLKGSVGTSLGAVLGGPVIEQLGHVTPSGVRGVVVDDASGLGRPSAPKNISVNGIVGALGVDPDDVSFAWTVTDTRRGAVQSGYRLMVVDLRPNGRRGETIWDSGVVHTAQQAFVPYGGPKLQPDTAYEVQIATADGPGTFGPAASARFVTGLRGTDWQASWLRPGPVTTPLETYRYLRRRLELPAGSIVRATAYVAAAHKYRLWANGTEVDSGPSFSYPDESYYQPSDVTSVLKAGTENVVGFLHHWYGPGKGRPTSAPGLLAQVSVHYSNGRTVVVGTDDQWLEAPGEWLPGPQRNNTVGDFVENIDGRLAPEGWSEAAFDDHSWSPAVVLGPVGVEPFTKLFAQRTRISESAVRPVSVKRLDDGAVVVDFGKVYAARPTVTFRPCTVPK